MKSLSDAPAPRVGLRERKKAKTREAIQRHAMRLFREQGYDETTVDQIAEAAEVSQSTFFRYFPSKEDLVLYDSLDPLLFDAYLAQPPELGPVAAFRAALRQTLEPHVRATIGPEWERQKIVLAHPELRGRMMDAMAAMLDTFTAIISERMGAAPDDPEPRSLAGAIVGIGIALWLTAPDDPERLLDLYDSGLALLDHVDTETRRAR